MTASVKLSLEGSMDQLRIVWQAGEALLESVAFGEDGESTRYNILVAVQEMVTNVLRHAYGGDEAHPIEVHFTSAPDRFAVELRDCGPEFDPVGYDLDGDPPAAALPDQVGGYGIMIARSVMDDITYARRSGWNCLRMTKLVDAAVAAR